MAQQFDHPYLPGVKFEIPANFPHAIQYDSNGFPFYTFGSDQAIPAIPEFTNPFGQEEFDNALRTAIAQGPQAVNSLFQNPRVPGLFRQAAAQDPSFANTFYGGGPTVDGLGGSFGFTGVSGGMGGGSAALSFGIPDITYYSSPSFANGASFLPGPAGSNGSASVGYSTNGGFSSSLINPNSAGGNGTSSDPLGGYGGLLALGLGGAGLLASLFGGNETKTTSQTQLPPMSAAELQLLGINTQLAMGQLGAYNTQLQQQGLQNPYISQLFNEQFSAGPTPKEVDHIRSECAKAGDAWPGGPSKCEQYYTTETVKLRQTERQEQQRKDELDRVARSGQSAQQSGQVGQQAFTDALQGSQQLRPDQLERIRGAADLSIQSGLSDIGRFRDEGLNQIRLNSAARGLRPGDTPIQNEFHDLATDSQRTAQNFVNNIRSQQLNTELTLPFEESRLRTANLGLSGDLALRRQALEESLRQNAQSNRIGLATNAQASGLGLATGLNPASAFGALTSARTAGGSTTQTNQASGLSQLAPILGGVGGLLQGYGSLYK